MITTQNLEVQTFLCKEYFQFKKRTFEAFPFLVPPEKAQRLLASWAAVTCNLGKLLPSLLAYPLPFLNLGFLRPARFSAAYFPAWFITGEVEARITYKGVRVRSIPIY